MKNQLESLRQRAEALHLHGVLAHWQDVAGTDWVEKLVQWEEDERAQRSLDRRIKNAHLGRFKPLCDFDWQWPKRCDRAAIEALMSLDFLREKANVILVGPNGVGKSMLAQNLAHQALIHGHTVLFASAGQLLGDMAALDSDSALRRRLRYYCAPDFLCVDEVGYPTKPTRSAPFQACWRNWIWQVPSLPSMRWGAKKISPKPSSTNRPTMCWRSRRITLPCMTTSSYGSMTMMRKAMCGCTKP